MPIEHIVERKATTRIGTCSNTDNLDTENRQNLVLYRDFAYFCISDRIIMQIAKNKRRRLEIIKEIINTQKIGNQSDLMRPLLNAGVEVTQATLSRDLKQLKIAKVPDNDGKYIYTLPKEDNMGRTQQYNSTFDMHPQVGLGGFLSINFSYNLAIIKTSPGFAGSIAYDIDTGNSPEILGTVAGDDTILIVMGENVSHERAYEVLSLYIPALRSY